MSPVVRFLILSRCVPHSFTTTLVLMPTRLELGGDGERDVLVERVAARRRVERELELGRVDARFLEEGLRLRRIVLEHWSFGE